MARPTTKVEIAFDAGWTGTPTWTDVTEYVRHSAGINITHWRGDEDDQCPPSSLSLTLKNDDGRFTPGNTSSPHSPNVKKGRRIRVTSTHDGTTYHRFNGYINDWHVVWPGKVSGYSDCVVTASSRMARLGRGTELRSIVEAGILQHDPVAYYTLGDPEGSTQAIDSSGNAQPSLTIVGDGADVVFGSATGPGTDGLTGATFAAGKYLRATPLNGDASSALTIEAFVSTEDTSGAIVTLSGASGEVDRLILVVTPGPSSTVLAVIYGGVFNLVSSTDVSDGLVHHVAVVVDDDTLRLYADGVEVNTKEIVSQAQDYDTLLVGQALSGSVSHVAVYTTALSAAQIAAHAAAGVDGFADETAAARLTRYADFAGVASADTDFDTGQVANLAHIDTTGKTALAMMREVETTEGGVLFDALDGTLTFHDRAHRYNVASSFTVDYDAGEVHNALSPVLDDRQQVNDATATNAAGVSARVVDQDSRDEYGEYKASVELHTTDASEPLQRASWIVAQYAEPPERISELEISLNSADDTLAAGVLAAEVSTRLTLSGLPSNAPASSLDLIVEGRSERITADDDRVILRTSPAALYEVLELDDATYGALDSYPLAY